MADPTTISDLGLYLAGASLDGTANGTAVAAWADLSTNGATVTQATAANQPTWDASAVSTGKGAVRFSGTAQWLNLLGTGLNIANGVPGMTIIVACKDAASATSAVRNLLNLSRGGTPVDALARVTTGINVGGYRVGGRRQDADSLYNAPAAGTLTAEWVILRYVLDFTNRNVAVWANGVQVLTVTGTAFATGGSTSAADSANGNIGANAAATAEFWNGWVRSLASYKRVLTDTEAASVEAHFTADISGAAAPTGQTLAPSADITTTGWATTGAASPFAALDEATASDTDYVSVSNPSGSVLEVKFAAATDPASNTGHQVRYRLRATGTSHSVRVSLMQGGTERAFWTHTNLTADFQTITQTLTAAQADSITDYGDLRLRVTATAS